MHHRGGNSHGLYLHITLKEGVVVEFGDNKAAEAINLGRRIPLDPDGLEVDPMTATRAQLEQVILEARKCGRLFVRGRTVRGDRGRGDHYERLVIQMSDVENVDIVEGEPDSDLNTGNTPKQPKVPAIHL